ncbi:hypothetical protein P7K49_001825, partial [Saguinus oedipus]
APGARLEPDVPRRRSDRHRRGALARSGWRAHGRAGRQRLARRPRNPPDFGPTPDLRLRKGETPAQRTSAPPRWESHPLDGWGPPRPSALSRRRESWLRNLPPC